MAPPNKPLEEKDLTEEKVRELLGKACRLELNIFYDQNHIIALLCKKLLRSWGKDPTKKH